MKIDERELFKRIMIGFMTNEDPMLAYAKMDDRTTDTDRDRGKSRCQ